MPAAANTSSVYRRYKSNEPFEGQQCFADYLNQSLRDGVPLAPPWATAAKELDQLIGASVLTQPTRLYRATIDAFVAKYIVGSELSYPAYMSTTTDQESLYRHFATAFRDLPAALLIIDCMIGSTALDMEQDVSFGGHEREMLLPRGAKFEVV